MLSHTECLIFLGIIFVSYFTSSSADTIYEECGPLSIVTLRHAECRNGTVQCKSGYHQGGSNCVNGKNYVNDR
ncbi:Uncharacterised protein g10964 [Pycnogonum litorale]